MNCLPRINCALAWTASSADLPVYLILDHTTIDVLSCWLGFVSFEILGYLRPKTVQIKVRKVETPKRQILAA
jgi:hypothetical protein